MKKLFYILVLTLSFVSCNKDNETKQLMLGQWDEVEHTWNGYDQHTNENDETVHELSITETTIYDKGNILSAEYTFEDNVISYLSIVNVVSYKVSFEGDQMVFTSTQGNDGIRRFNRK